MNLYRNCHICFSAPKNFMMMMMMMIKCKRRALQRPEHSVVYVYTGCPDLYRRYTNSHMFQGVLKPPTSLLECQRSCLEERNCLGVDWNKHPSASTTDSRRCYFVYPESTRYGVQPAGDYCCDHYRRTYCLSTAVPRPGHNNTTTVRPSWLQHPAYTVTRQRMYCHAS